VSHYRLLNPLGSGGMGVVYRAEDTALGRTVALKFLSSQIVQDPKRVERFRDEARNASSLNHPNIITIHDIVTIPAGDCIVMELVKGQTLGDMIGSGKIPAVDCLKLAMQIAADVLAQRAWAVPRDWDA